ncbi:MAG: hypothetical protein IPJ79_01180 [Bacteroidetes bacterium]|nr:hypothetical protein [Bacteroidota bacterium]
MKLSNNVVHIATFLILLSLISCGDSKDKSKADDSNTVLQTQKIISDSSKAVNNLDSLKRELKKLEDSKRFVDEKLSLSFFDAKKIAENKFLKEGKRTILVGLNPRDWLETNNGVLIESWELVFKDNFNNEMINAIVRLEINEDNKIERNLEYSVLNLASCDSLNKIKNETIDGTNKFLCTYANANPINDIYLDMNQILKIADASAKRRD